MMVSRRSIFHPIRSHRVLDHRSHQGILLAAKLLVELLEADHLCPFFHGTLAAGLLARSSILVLVVLSSHHDEANGTHEHCCQDSSANNGHDPLCGAGVFFLVVALLLIAQHAGMVLDGPPLLVQDILHACRLVARRFREFPSSLVCWLQVFGVFFCFIVVIFVRVLFFVLVVLILLLILLLILILTLILILLLLSVLIFVLVLIFVFILILILILLIIILAPFSCFLNVVIVIIVVILGLLICGSHYLGQGSSNRFGLGFGSDWVWPFPICAEVGPRSIGRTLGWCDPNCIGLQVKDHILVHHPRCSKHSVRMGAVVLEAVAELVACTFPVEIGPGIPSGFDPMVEGHFDKRKFRDSLWSIPARTSESPTTSPVRTLAFDEAAEALVIRLTHVCVGSAAIDHRGPECGANDFATHRHFG
mmetsp:Transcript_89853/g.187834  ORF Transcript_89853/g.187834 Transcript_89853/m.187834 type:complete len:420 (-) Transcript_89853:300-1559(-)